MKTKSDFVLAQLKAMIDSKVYCCSFIKDPIIAAGNGGGEDNK